MVTERGGFILLKNNNYRLQGDLVLSRSFGDYVYKEFLSVEPDIHKFPIKENDKYLIMATDGFWKLASMEELTDIILKWEDTMQGEIGLSKYLTHEVLKKSIKIKKDNISVLVFNIKSILSQY